MRRTLLTDGMAVNPSDLSFLALARRPAVVGRAVRTALLVGVLLALINHGSALLRWDLDLGRWLQIALTFVVPYCVSTYASVSTLRESNGAGHG